MKFLRSAVVHFHPSLAGTPSALFDDDLTLPSEEAKTYRVSETFVHEPRPESGTPLTPSPNPAPGKAARKAIDSYNSAGKFDILVLGITIGGSYQTQVAFAEIGGNPLLPEVNRGSTFALTRPHLRPLSR